jgi:hypothetical protein
MTRLPFLTRIYFCTLVFLNYLPPDLCDVPAGACIHPSWNCFHLRTTYHSPLWTPLLVVFNLTLWPFIRYTICLSWLGLWPFIRYMSEEISSRVTECTRLILVKEEFRGDLRVLDRWADERRKDIRILEWFGPLERNTLRSLGCCIDCGSLDWTRAWDWDRDVCTCRSNGCTLPFIVQGRCLHRAGPR